MKIYGQNIPSENYDDWKESLQLPTRRIASDTNMYNNEVYNQTKYHTNYYTKKRDPFRIPHMQGNGRLYF